MSSGATGKFQCPKPGADVDPGSFFKLAQRVEQTLTSDALYPEPKQLDPNVVMPSPYNRLGAPPNVQHLHHGILKSIFTNSFDRTRPLVGICVEYKSEAGIKKVLEHNQRFTQGNKLLPPILEEVKSGPVYASLACSHLNLALRCIKTGTHSPTGDLSSLLQQTTLKDVAVNGHKWWILPETLAKDKQTDISLWRNQDQNENQGAHELEILQTIKTSAEAFLATGKAKVNLGDLVNAASKRNPAKTSPTCWMSLAKYYIGFLENGMVDMIEDLADFHSSCIDPAQLTVSLKFFHTLGSEEAFKKCPQVRHYLTTTQYTPEKVVNMPKGPAVCAFLELTQILSFAKKTDQVQQLEKTIRELKAKYLPILAEALGERVSHLEITEYIGLVIRCLFCKPWPEHLNPKVALPLGKFSAEKIKSLGTQWAKVVDLKHPGIDFAVQADLQPEVEAEEDTQIDVSLENLRGLKRNASGGPDPEAPKFERGDEVTVIRKMTWHLPQKSNPNFRKDLAPGLGGVIEGWADSKMQQVLLKVNLNIGGKSQSHTQGVYPRNLKLTSEYLLTKAGEAASSSGPAAGGKKEEPVDDVQKSLKWIVGSSSPADVKVESKWKTLQADDDTLTKNMYLRGRISTGLQALSESLPKYSDKDFILAHRKNEKGIWKHEIYTKRDFEPFEILLAPQSSAIKESHLMANAHAVVTIPKHGRGAHPENMSLALDGRCRNVIANKGVLDPEEHTGSLYWIVTRTSDTKQVNLDWETCTWEQDIKLHLPGPAKKRKVAPVQWSSSELPSFPVLLNKKAIKKNTKLCVFVAEKKKENKGKK